MTAIVLIFLFGIKAVVPDPLPSWVTRYFRTLLFVLTVAPVVHVGSLFVRIEKRTPRNAEGFFLIALSAITIILAVFAIGLAASIIETGDVAQTWVEIRGAFFQFLISLSAFGAIAILPMWAMFRLSANRAFKRLNQSTTDTFS